MAQDADAFFRHALDADAFFRHAQDVDAFFRHAQDAPMEDFYPLQRCSRHILQPKPTGRNIDKEIFNYLYDHAIMSFNL